MLLCSCIFSCSKNNSADTETLLATIPSDVSAVTVVNLRSILDKSGCKIDGDKITPGKEILSAIAISQNQTIKNVANLIFSGDSGIDPSVAAFFIEGFNTYLTGFVADTEKFKQLVEKEFMEDFTSSDNIEKCGSVALQGNRFWMCVSSLNTIELNSVKHFITLSENQSFISSIGAENLKKPDHDLMLWADIKGIMNATETDFNTKAMTNVALEAMFADASMVEGCLDFMKGKMQLDLGVFNSKGERSKFLFPLSKIDPEVVKMLDASGNLLFAAAISSKLIDKILKETEGKGVSLIGIYAQALSCVDGTCAIALAGGEDEDNSLKGIITTSGKDSSTLTGMLSMFGVKTEQSGNRLLISKGNPTGTIIPANVASEMKGAMIAATVSPDAAGKNSGNLLNNDKVKDITVLVTPKDKSIEMTIKATSKNEKDNFILSLL